MTTEDSVTKQVIASLRKSGFPFQTAIASVVRGVADCEVKKEEYPWRDDTGVVRFLDLVVSKHNFLIAIECKKTEKEIFTFLQPTASGTSQEDVVRSRCLYRNQVQDAATWYWELCCGDWDIKPKSPESAFCVVSTSESGDRRLLEKDAQLLIGGANAFGNSLIQQPKRAPGDPYLVRGDDYRVIVPVIVTNAKLFAARCDPQSVALETGQLPTSWSDISPVDSVRFRKSFTASNPDEGYRTVFVVCAHSLAPFLQGLDYVSEEPSPRAVSALWRG
jgi:hypothetical protein